MPVAILLLALTLRTVAAFWWQSRLPDAHAFGFPDSYSYWVLGEQLALGNRFEFGYGAVTSQVFRTPGYPVVLALLFSMTGINPPIIWARLLGALMGTLAVGLVMGLATRLFDRRTALVAGLLAAVYPGAVGMSIFVLSESPFCPWMIAQLLGWICAWQATDRSRQTLGALLAGVAAGVATLMRPSWLLFTPFAALGGMVLVRERSKQLRIVLLMLAALGLTMLPWWWRNYQVAGRWVPTTLQFGASLYDGWNPHATGASNMDFVFRFHRAQVEEDGWAETEPEGIFEDRLDRRLRRAAVAWAREHPARAAQLAVIKTARMWSPWPSNEQLTSWSIRIATAAGYLPLLALATAGGWWFCRRGWPYVLCLLPAVYLTCLHAVFVSSLRYRQPAMLVLTVLAAGAMVQIVDGRAKRVAARKR